MDGLPVEGTFRAHQVPLAGVKDNPEHLAMLEAWMRSYRPEELFDAAGRLAPRARGAGPDGAIAAWAPTRTPMAASELVELDLPASATTRSR